MKSRDPERSRSRPGYLWSLISQKPFKIAGRCQWNTHRKSDGRSGMVTWPMMSRDFEKSKSSLGNIWSLISRNPHKLGLFYFWILGVLCDVFGVIYANMPTNWSPRLTDRNSLHSNGIDTAFHRTYSCYWKFWHNWYMAYKHVLTSQLFSVQLPSTLWNQSLIK